MKNIDFEDEFISERIDYFKLFQKSHVFRGDLKNRAMAGSVH